MSVAYRLSPFRRITTAVSLLAALGLMLLPGCMGAKRTRAKTGSPTRSEAPPSPEPVNAHHASYGVSWTNGSTSGEGTYSLAYVLKDNAPVVVESERNGFSASSGSDQSGSAARADKIQSYLTMSPIRAIIGERTDFTMGQTYNGIAMEGGKPIFTYTCDRDEEIAGVKGQRLTVKSARKGATELELVLSRDYPFPLYVKEHTGVEPLQIFLKDRQ